MRQIEGYRAFNPSPLPPVPPLNIDSELNGLLADATLAIGRLDGAIQILPNPDLLVLMYIRKEAVLSSQIEGTQSSLSDVLAAEANIHDPRRPKDVSEVINYVNAMNFGLNRLDELPVSVRLIRELHERLLQNIRGRNKTPGEIRTSQNWIGPEGCTLRDALYVPPPPSDVSQCLSDLERYIHATGTNHNLIRIGLVHAQFETIHPFLDGNGRIGRLMITLLLCECGLLQKPLLYISYYFKKNRQQYYDRLQATRDNGDFENWIKFFLRGITEVSGEAARTAAKIVALRETHRNLIQENLAGRGNNAMRVLEGLYQHPFTNVNSVAEMLGVTYPAANGLVAELTKLDILRETTGQQRNRLYAYPSYLDLFGDT